MLLSRAFAKVPGSVVIASVTMAVVTSVIATGPVNEAFAFSPGSGTFVPGNLLVSTSQWQQNANITARLLSRRLFPTIWIPNSR